MRISQIQIKDFKSIKILGIVTNGENVSIVGENGTGKSTIKDAFTWCLTGKLSDGTDGGDKVLPIGAAQGTTASVDITFATDKREFGISRKLTGKYDESGNLTGTTAKFTCDGVSCNKKQFDAFIQKFVPAEGLNYLVSPKAFCSAHWTEQRKLLIGLCDDNLNVIEEEKYLPIRESLERYSVVDFQKLCKQRIKDLKEKMSGIPAVIAELESQAETGEKSSVEEEIKTLAAEQEKLTKEIYEIESSSGETKRKDIEKRLADFRQLVSRSEKQIANMKADLENAREAFRQAGKSKCPTCGQSLPTEQVKTRLEKIRENGKKIAAAIKTDEKFLIIDKKSIAEMEKQLEEMTEVGEMTEKVQAMKSQLEEVKTKLDAAKQKLFRLEQTAKNQTRIEELKKSERIFSGEISRYEAQLNLAKEFSLRTAKTLEDKINAKFEFVKWKLFETQMNGEIKECCEPMIDGVPYKSLNKGGKFKTEADILKTLQEFYQVELPLFIDDAESYTSNSFVELPNQIFKLTVAEGVKELQITIEEKAVESKAA